MRYSIVALLAFALFGCRAKPPEIARDLPSNYEQGQRIFDARLKEQFPVGSNEAYLVVALMNQGFEIETSLDGSYAHFSDGGIPVKNIWNVGWKASDGKITEIWGVYGGVGP